MDQYEYDEFDFGEFSQQFKQGQHDLNFGLFNHLNTGRLRLTNNSSASSILKREGRRRGGRQALLYRPTSHLINLANLNSRSRPVATPIHNFRNHQSYQTDQCQKLINNSYTVNNKELGGMMKKLKRIFLEKYPQSKDLKVKVSKVYPMIYFTFEDRYRSIKNKHFKDAVREMPVLKKHKYIFQKMFQKYFSKVSQKYHKLIQLGIEKGKQEKIYLKKNKIINADEDGDVMFYYVKKSNQEINFVVFDRYLRYVEFNNKYIEGHQKSHPREFDTYKSFCKKIFSEGKEKQEEGIDIFDKEELQSDEEDRDQYQKLPLAELKSTLNKLLAKSLDYLDAEIEEINEQIETLQIDNKKNAKITELNNQIEQIEENKDNYEKVKKQISQDMQKCFYMSQDKTYKFFKNSIKKLILAEKQLESNLPIINKKKEIIEMLGKNENLFIIEGETGSGKSTQLPQILCEYYKLLDNDEALPVLVTQPRRLATRSLAQRVAKQMGQKIGGFVDYVSSMDRQANENAKIVFKLDRLVLDELTQDPILSKYSCLVIDEAHERTISIDVILGLVKKLLKKRKNFKVIITSASMNLELFETYFDKKTLKIPGRVHPITIAYKDYQNYKDGDRYELVRKIERVINTDILQDNNSMKNEFKGHLLCFCSSIQEIDELVKIYSAKLNKNVFKVYALHGKITANEQKQIFEDATKHKFIFASRIAETAITIDGVRVVIDPGKDMELVYDQRSKISSMKLQEIAQSSAKQRAGRSGRTGPGYCFRLYSQQNFKKRRFNKVPEMENSSLENVVLRLKTLNIPDVINFSFISKPSIEGLRTSVQTLKLIGALSVDGKVTKIGQLLIKIPMQPFLSRAIIQAMMFKNVLLNQQVRKKLQIEGKELENFLKMNIQRTVVEILALVVNFSNLFFIKTGQKEKGQAIKFNEFSDEEGDFFFLNNIFQKYKKLKQNIALSNNRNKEDNTKKLVSWIEENYLNWKALKQTQDLVEEIWDIVQGFIIKPQIYNQELKRVQEKLLSCKNIRQVILSCLITSFSPNLCKFSNNSQIGYTMVSQRKPVQIYKTSNLSLLGIQPDWIICYDFFTNEGRLFSKVAHKVSYTFMEMHVNKNVWERYDIEGIQNRNPFYKELSFDVATKILQQIRSDYCKCEDQVQLQFLRGTYPILLQQQNKVSFFFQTPKNSQEQAITQHFNNFQKRINAYLSKMKDELQSGYRHNYIGTIFVNMKSGFQIENILFENRQYCIEIIGTMDLIRALHPLCEIFGRFQIEEISIADKLKLPLRFRYQSKKIKVYLMELGNRDTFMNFVNDIKNQRQAAYQHLQTSESIVSKSKKQSDSKLVINFFAGYCEKQNVFMSYPEQGTARKMLNLIIKGINTYNLTNNIGSSIEISNLKLSKKQNGINIFNHTKDEYDTSDQLSKLHKNGVFGDDFVFPKYINRYRLPNSSSLKSNDDWKNEIHNFLKRIDVKPEDVSIQIRGYYRPGKIRRGEIRDKTKRYRVNMSAEVTSANLSILPRIKNGFDGKNGILGSQKIHIKLSYEQIVALPSLQTFQALQQAFQVQTSRHRSENPNLTFVTNQRRIRNKDRIMIKVMSSNKEDFSKVSKDISNIFTPKIMKLDYTEYYFLDKMKEGKQILQTLEEEFNYKIHFEMESLTKCLKVYCQQNQIRKIEIDLRLRIKLYTLVQQKISYRGKNLNKVKEILQETILNLHEGEVLSYEIIFDTYEVKLTADIVTLQRTKNALLKLNNIDKGECGICTDIMKNPFRFLNCNCSFCWLCVSDHIRAFRNNPSHKTLLCPDEQCKTPINVNDVKTLLSEEEFQKICDIKIINYVQRFQDQYISCSSCENIFSVQELKNQKEFCCDICGKVECLMCHTSHQNYTCEEWKNRNDITSYMSKLGIKACPSCGNGIQKSHGCNHIHCKKCQAHFCWICLQKFQYQKTIYDHLVKIHGGIFSEE